MRGFSRSSVAAVIFAMLTVNWLMAGTSHSTRFVGAFTLMETECSECTALFNDEELEMEMDSEINKRILATSKYISYGALKKNSIPCSRRGASYYNCQRGAEANPYSRGCSAITRCRH